ncbi:E3 ubiquitin-protein ligase TRIM39-like [Myxocyprinus asiaticus]|uniref:E3 ubiquitin-protein ligase TRIM39-like n=1 Tax=Myxocyprinus asiaticus TaxID=70543 RepID=UPI002223E2A3|nr:E3 ubiquitin-protein ligase TRIM39-like [Myxocyprinus asiaticus]
MATAVDISRHLHCPICKNLLAEPVSTSCGHTFCKRCLDQYISMSDPQCALCQEPLSTKPSVNAMLEALLREFHQTQLSDLSLFTGERDEIPCDICDEQLTFVAVKSCLICLMSYCEHHLKQHQSTARLKGHKLVCPLKKLDQRACSVHGRPLELYSRQDERCICALCVKKAGDVTSVETERERRQAVQQNTIEQLEKMIILRQDKLGELQETATNCQALIEREQQEIKEVFAAVTEAVRRAEEVLLAPLEDGRRCLEKEMEEKTQQIKKEILKYKEAIVFFNDTKNEEDDILYLQSYPCVLAEFKDDWTVSMDTELNFGTMRNLKAAVLAQIESRLEKLCSVEIQRIQKFSVDVLLDAETAHPCLEVSPDGKTVRDSGKTQESPGSPKQFNLVGGILGTPQIMSGRAFWIVEVGQKAGWELGVVREGAKRKGKISYKPSEGYWAIVLCGEGMYGAFEDPPVQLQLSSKPQKVGVFVDCEEALVSFYDMDALAHIYTFTKCSFNEAVRPYFNPHPNNKGNNSAPMVICSVNQADICM